MTVPRRGLYVARDMACSSSCIVKGGEDGSAGDVGLAVRVLSSVISCEPAWFGVFSSGPVGVRERAAGRVLVIKLMQW